MRGSVLACPPVILSVWGAAGKCLGSSGTGQASRCRDREPVVLSFDRACLQALDFWKVGGSPERVVGGRGDCRAEVFHDRHHTL